MQNFARSHVEQIDPNLLPALVKEIRLQGYLQCLATVALIYDALITMSKEIKYFWKFPRKPVDFVYFSNRYIGILGAVAYLSHSTLSAKLEECNFALWTRDVASWITVVLVDYILTIRVLALCSGDRMLAICLYLILALEAVAKLSIIIYVDIFEHVAVGGAGGITICVCGQERYPRWWLGIVDWSLQLVYGIILLVLALYNAAGYWRLSAGFKGFTLVKVLIIDQVIYFMSVILVSIFAMVEFKLAGVNAFTAAVLTTLGSPSFLCILGSRMLLNMREAGERGQNEGTNLVVPSRTIGGIEFGAPPANVEGTQTEAAIDE